MQISRESTIINKLDMHARAAAKFVKLASEYGCDIEVELNGRRVNGKSIMGVLMLAAERGSTLSISAIGPDADAAADALSALVSHGFRELDADIP